MKNLLRLLLIYFFSHGVVDGAEPAVVSPAVANAAVDNQEGTTALQDGRLFKPFYPNYLVVGADSQLSSTDFNDDNLDREDLDLRFQLSFVSQFNTGATEYIRNKTGVKFVDIFGPFYFGFTQEAYWDIGLDSAPFRETNYRPEFFFRFPHIPNLDLYYGYIHESNGKDGDESGGWDRVFARVNIPFGRPISKDNATSFDRQWNFDLRVWHILNGTVSNRNSDIRDFAGDFEAIVNVSKVRNKYACLWRRKCGFTLMMRKGGSFISGFDHGLVQFEYRTPITATGVQLVAQFSSGDGFSIERHDVHETAFRVGIQFTDLFNPDP